MKDEDKTKAELISELTELRRRILDLTRSSSEHKQVNNNISKNYLDQLVNERTSELIAANQKLLLEIERRKRSEKALGEQVHFLQKLIATIPNPIFYKDIDGIFKGCNKAFKEYMGFNKRIEDELQASEEKYKQLLKYAPAGIYEIDLIKLKFTGINDAMCKYTGYTEEEFLSMNPFKILSEDSRKHFAKRLKTNFSGQSLPDTTEWEIVRKDGQKLWVLAHTKYFYKDSKPVYAMVVAHNITERKRMEDALKESNKKYVELFDNANDIIYIHDFKGDFLSVNSAAVRVYGYTKEEFLKLNISQILGANYRPIVQEYIRQKFLGSKDKKMKDKSYEILTYTQKGVPVWVEVSTRLLRDNGKPVGIQGIARDVTGRKQAKKALLQQKQRLRKQLIFSNALNRIAETITYHNDTQIVLENMVGIVGRTLALDRVLIFYTDYELNQIKGLCEWLNPAIDSVKSTFKLEMFMHSCTFMKNQKQYIESHIDDYSPYLLHDGVIELLHNQMKIKSLLWYPFAFHEKGFYCLVFNQVNSYRRWRDEEMEFINAVAKHVEIAIQKILIQKERKRTREAFTKAFNFSPDLMAITSFPHGYIIDVNKGWLKVMGYLYNEATGQTVQELGIWRDVGERRRLRRALQEKGSVHNLEMTFVTKDGEERIGLFSGDIINLFGRECCLAVIKDITDLRKLEKEMVRLEQLNLVGQMAAGIGHEVRNPMTTVRGFLQMFSAKKEFSTQKQYFDLMIEELDRANSIITQFLSLAKDKPVVKQNQNLNTIIETLFPLIQADVFKSDMQIDLELQEVPDLLIDEKEIRQLLLNLCRNGLDAMSTGQTLTIGTFADADNVVLTVRDQGKGIPSEVLDKLGTPFLTTKAEGTGLGLAVCYSVAARHNATIDVETGPEGTTFFVRFKRAGFLTINQVST